MLVTGPVSINTQSYIDKYIEAGVGEVIFSTWTCEESSYSNTIWSEDCGSEGRSYEEGGVLKPLNLARQNTLILAGLRKVKTSYVIRVRSGIFLDIEALIKQASEAMISGLVASVDVSSVSPKRWLGEKLEFHPCDWVFAGLTDVLINIVRDYCDESLLDCGEKHISSGSRKVFSKVTAEQYFALNLNRIDFSSIASPSDLGSGAPSPIAFGFYIVSGKKIDLKSDKYGLKNYRFQRIYSNENFLFKVNFIRSLPDLVVSVVKKGVLYVKGK